ncbi:hypothetical protein Tco_1097572 [Tanacetum coccineum]
MVIREPKSGKFQPLLEVQGKGKEERRTSTQTKPTGHGESSSLYVELGLIDNETDSDEEVSGIDAGVQDEGQAGPNPEQMDEEFTTTAYPNVQENLKLPTEGEVRLEEPARSAGTLSSLQNLNKELSFTNQFLSENLSTRPSTMIQAPLPTSAATIIAITTTTTSLPPIPPQPQQGSSYSILIQRISELEQHMADMVEANQALEERLDKQGNRLYNLENLDIPHKVSKAVDEIITDAVDWAI